MILKGQSKNLWWTLVHVNVSYSISEAVKLNFHPQLHNVIYLTGKFIQSVAMPMVDLHAQQLKNFFLFDVLHRSRCVLMFVSLLCVAVHTITSYYYSSLTGISLHLCVKYY